MCINAGLCPFRPDDHPLYRSGVIAVDFLREHDQLPTWNDAAEAVADLLGLTLDFEGGRAADAGPSHADLRAALARAALALEPSATKDTDAAYNLGLLLVEVLRTSEHQEVDAALERLLQTPDLHPAMRRILGQEVEAARHRR
jgi:hypothetical protein